MFRLGQAGAAVTALCALGWVYTDHCRTPAPVAAALPEVRGEGPLEAGAGRARIAVTLPAARAGYGPLEPRAAGQVAPLSARALAVGAGQARLVLVTLDLLTVPESLAEEVASAARAAGAGAVLVAATHSHSSIGGYDERGRLALAGLGWPDAEVRRAVVSAGVEAARQALGTMVPAKLSWGTAEAPELVKSRVEGEAADARLSRVRLESEDGRVAELLVFAAHPTLEPRRGRLLSPDYPGALSERLEAGGGGVVLTVVGAGGNAMAVVPGQPAPEKRVETYARALAERAERIPLGAPEVEGVVSARAAAISLPRPDASRLVSGWLRRPAENALCGLTREVRVVSWKVGPLVLVALPAEVTAPAGERLERAAGAGRAVTLAGGYLGYVDTEDRVRAGTGESRRQYFAPELLGALERAAALAAR